jgi:hypothetical protein
VGPTLTDQERSAQEAKRRQDQAEQQRLREERSRERAMLARFPARACMMPPEPRRLPRSTM